MAYTVKEPTVLPELDRKEESELVVAGRGGEAVSSRQATDERVLASLHPDHTEKSTTGSASPADGANPGRPSLIQLKSSALQNSSTPPTSHPKRFSAVNINKKFLEKNSSASGSTPTSANTATVKSGGPASRPTSQSSFTHSRLVTTKLTATPQASTAGPGWSRPSSATPTIATGSSVSPNGTSPLLSAPPVPPSIPAAPQLPHAGKVIQPQPRAALVQPASHRDGFTSGGASNKPVWGNLKTPSGSAQRPDVRVHNDFPTAAEVAQVVTTARKAKLSDSKEAAEAAAANKQARMEEADTFRGVHLDPNAHHWDEMEEDDDNFLDGVIEFGDGRQYKIESTDVPPSTQLSDSASPPPRTSSKSRSRLDGISPQKDPASGIPVSKEERFADDFDRSWPRSRTSPSLSVRDFPSATSAPSVASTTSPVASHALHSPQDASRVLFNERSNRLEPYSNAHRPTQGQHAAKRGSQSEFSGSPNELRVGRDLPSMSPSHNNVQLLQKVDNLASRSRRFSNTSSNFGSGPSDVSLGDRQRDRDRDHPSRRDGPPLSSSMHPPPSPRLSKDNHTSFGLPTSTGREKDLHNESRGRRTSMGPPPLPLHSLTGHAKDNGRQLPPHLSQISPVVPQRRLPSRDSRFPILPAEPISASRTAHTPSQSPILLHASASVSASSPSLDHLSLPQLSAPELDEVRKDVMQSAAARAKQRRQQEEEEREKEKERARRKAVELEERMKAAEVEKAKLKEASEVEKSSKSQDETVNAIIQDAVENVEPSKQDTSTVDLSLPPKASRLTLTRQPPQPIPETTRTSARRTSTSSLSAAPANTPAAPPAQSESWRSKASPLPPPAEPRHTHARRSSVPSFVPPLSAIQQVESLADNPEEVLEVIDFLDFGKFVGVVDAPEEVNAIREAQDVRGNAATRLSRPVASDFFDDEPSIEESVVPAKGEGRLKESQSTSRDQSSVVQDRSSAIRSDPPTDVSVVSEVASTIPTKEVLTSMDHYHTSQTVTLPPQSGVQRTPRSQSFYKEAAMSALDDAMSRIKGALDGMQTGETTKEVPNTLPEQHMSTPRLSASPAKVSPPPKEDRWVPPALRRRTFDHEPREVFHATVNDPPRSPKPVWSSFLVRLPKVSRSVELVNNRHIHLFTKASQSRWDILTIEPSTVGTSWRDNFLNDLLFGKPQVGFKGRLKCRVILPRSRSAMQPRVNIPGTPKINGHGAFGRTTSADSLTTWRKAASSIVSTAKPDDTNVISPELGLSTISRSPPPELLSSATSTTSIPKPDPATDSVAKIDESPVPARSRTQPKMPMGSAVAFYRGSHIDAVESEPKPTVNFIVTSELEESRQSSQTATPVKSQPNITVSSPSHDIPVSGVQITSGLDSLINDGLKTCAPSAKENQSKADGKNSGGLTERAPTSHHHTTPWTRSSLSHSAKDSSVRGPDPEHLKAVWSQTSNKAGLHPVNSLEGIADDLTALPFTLQDVKSEDGETPPPSIPSAPSRMSLHDVTRAFQTVPSSSSNSTQHRTTISPPSTSAPITRPASYSYIPPTSSNNMRPAYGSYPSPMMSHTPSPTVVYPHPMVSSPVPNRLPVNGHTPLYSQPMWMAAQRPLTSPYPAQLMSYPSPATPAMYAPPPPPNMQNSSQQNGGPNRGRSMSMMSPVMPHAGTQMYGGSPILMHAPVHQNHGYMPIPAGRGQGRPENGQITMQHPPPNHHPPPQHPGYSSSFARPPW